MFEEGSFRRRPRGFRRKALKPYPGAGALYGSGGPGHVADTCGAGGAVPRVGGAACHGSYDAASPAVSSSAGAGAEYPSHAGTEPLLPTSHPSFVPFNNNHVPSSVLSGNFQRKGVNQISRNTIFGESFHT